MSREPVRWGIAAQRSLARIDPSAAAGKRDRCIETSRDYREGCEGVRSEATDASVSFGSSAVVGSFVASRIPCGVAEGARTRGFAAPAFAGCAFVEGW